MPSKKKSKRTSKNIAKIRTDKISLGGLEAKDFSRLVSESSKVVSNTSKLITTTLKTADEQSYMFKFIAATGFAYYGVKHLY